jgi:foldase protein PrsA
MGRYYQPLLMRRSMKLFGALGAFFVVAALVAGCGGGGVPSNSVAVVAGNPISTQAFDHWMFVAAKSQAAQSPGSPVIVPEDPPKFTSCIAEARADVSGLARTPTKTLRTECKSLFTSLSNTVMDFLIKGYWYQAEAARDHIHVTNKQVQAALNAAKTQQFQTPAQFQSFLTETGQTLADITFRFRINQLYTKLIAKHTKAITAAAIQAYYSAHPSQFGTPESRDIRIVLAKSAASADAAKAALQSGQSWNVVAKKYSTDPTSRNNGGLLKNVVPGEEDAALNKAAFAAPVDKLLGPVHGQFGYYVFEVISIKKATQQSLAQATALIRETLTGQQQTSAETAVDNAASKHWKSLTKCLSDYAMSDCSGYKAPKGSSTTGTSTGTATGG